MENPPLPLSAQLTGLRAAILADSRCVWVPAAVHAWIVALLARLLGRLEEVFRLWQSGALVPPPRHAPPARLPSALRPAKHRHARKRRRAIARPNCATAHRTAPGLKAPQAARPPIAQAPAPRPRPARDPPPAGLDRRMARQVGSPCHALFITLS